MEYTGQGGDMMAGIGIGIQNAITNLMNIQGAKQKLNQDKKTFDLDTKIKKLQLQKIEPFVDPELIQGEVDLQKNQVKVANSLYELHNSMIDAAAKGEKEKLAALQQKGQAIASMFDSGILGGKQVDTEEKLLRKVAIGGRKSLTASEQEALDIITTRKKRAPGEGITFDNPGGDNAGTTRGAAAQDKTKEVDDFVNQF